MSIESEIAIMQQTPVFQGVDPARLRLLAMSGDHVHFSAGEIMLKSGDPPDDVIFILDGKASTDFDFEVQTLVGCVSVFLRKPHAVTIVAETAVEALRVPARDFLDLIGHCNQISLAVLKELSRIVYAVGKARRQLTGEQAINTSATGDRDDSDHD